MWTDGEEKEGQRKDGCVTNDMLEKGVNDAMMLNREWKKMTCCGDPKLNGIRAAR